MTTAQSPIPAAAAPPAPPALRRGFTLVEMLVAVAAVTLIILGVTRIFAATGETLRAGRRVSYLNTYAALIEQQLREDITSMSRDGFLLIRHELVDAPLAPDAATVQRRRVDELVLFRTGHFRSKREPILDTNVIAEATEARIYYGHGMRMEAGHASYDDVNPYQEPPAAAMRPLGQPGGANEYASNWILMRHVTLLTGEPGTAYRRPVPALGGADRELDSIVQYAYQPAAADVFRNLLDVSGSLGGVTLARRFSGSGVPYFSTGVVDIATTSLADIRSIILDAQDPALTSSPPFNLDADEMGIWFEPDSDVLSGGAADFMHQWMARALPTDSDSGRRMRCELSPPNPLGFINGSRASATPDAHDEIRMDRMMLLSSNFVPHCTEFKVEWSFGQPQPTLGSSSTSGALAWYGEGYDNVREQLYARTPYLNGAYRFGTSIPRQGTPRIHRTLVDLIHGVGGTVRPTNDRAYSFFGYLDPTYVPQADIWDASENAGSSQPYRPDEGDITSEPLAMPWQWPRLLRITIKLVDPSDPTTEATYQYVFEVPQRESVQ